ncbi:MAG TPA: hypothetical protein VG816_08485 [Solirubrobacterales bacterium]|nr:hypothetical protein [Solirubrobacterales bacterium]
MARRLLAFCALTSLWLVAAVSVAQADTGNIIEPNSKPATAKDGWQAATCNADEPTKCSPNNPDYFVEAGGHPEIGYTQYTIQHEEGGTGNVEPAGIPIPISPIKGSLPNHEIKTLRVDLPPGLTVNPQATPHCTIEDFENEVAPGTFVPACDKGSRVGTEEVTLVTTVGGVVPAPSPPFPAGNTLPAGAVVPPSTATGTKVPVYNLEPKAGEPALFGFVVAGKEIVYLETDVSWESDYHEAFTIRLPESDPPFTTLQSRLVNFGKKAGNIESSSGNGTYLSTPTTCFDPNEWPTLYPTWFRAESYGEPNPLFPNGSTPFEARVESSTGELFQQKNCDTVPFEPTVDVAPGTASVDSPAAADVVTKVPFDLPELGKEQAQSHLRKAIVTLPAGMGLNPAGSSGLVACTDAQFKKGVRTYNNECPAASRIGTATIDSPPLERPLTGDIYVGEQKSSSPESGEEFRILVEAKEPAEGIAVRLVGNTAANAKIGQLTTTFDEQEIGPLAGKLPTGLPQAPFKSVTLHFDGSQAVLTSPPTCSAAETTGQMEPWARPGTQVGVKSSFTLSSVPGGGTCPTTLAERKFTPPYTAKSDSTKAGAYSPFRVNIGRPDGQQELKGVNVTLPKGLTGNLSGIPYCSEEALSAAAGKTGAEEKASSSCSDASKIGTTSTTAGTGNHPVTLPGSAYLAGPYKGAPLSMAVITPALSGPFDLGTVVVRVALNVNPKTAQVNAVSDAIPDVFGGVKLDLRAIDVNVDRSKFMVNPTNCAAQATAGFLNGGGGNPLDPAAWSSYAVSAPYQASQCNKLGFKPKLHTRLFAKGNTTRAKHPKLRAILETRSGDANVLRSALALPHALFLDQGNIRTVCTKPQLASRTCPKAAVYGHAEAKSPLLDKKLKGPVYLVSSSHELPDLVADLRGQVNIQLYGVISSKNGGIKTVFNNAPDVPVKKFILRMEGGKKHGLLVNSRNLCQGEKLSSVMNLKGQNGKKVKNNKLPLQVSGCSKKKK